MKLYKTHPYLFWQLIGFALLLVDFIYIMINIYIDYFDSENDAYYLIIVFTAIAASFIIFLSPIIIYFKRKSSNNSLKVRFDKYIIDSYNKNNHYWQGIVVSISMVAIFLAITMILCNWGLPIFAPLSLYIDTIIYVLWKKYIISKFYRVKNVEQHCKLINVDDVSFIDTLYKSNAFTFITSLNSGTLNSDFLYNNLNYHSLIKEQGLKIYVLTVDCLNKRYSFKVDNNICLMCILSDDLNTTENNIVDSIYDGYMFMRFDEVINKLLAIYLHNHYLQEHDETMVNR